MSTPPSHLPADNFISNAASSSASSSQPAPPATTPAPRSTATLELHLNPALLYPADAPPYEVAVATNIKLHDAKRDKDILLRVTYPKKTNRRLTTDPSSSILIPPPASAPFSQPLPPFPLLLWSHGMFGSKDAYTPLVRHWASYGYIILQPTHEDSATLGTSFGDWAQGAKAWASRPQDIQFLLDSIPQIARQIPQLPPIDLQHIGIGGHSFGAHTTQLLAGTQPRILHPLTGLPSYTSFAEPRASCFLMISPQGQGPLLTTQSFQHFTKPGFFITGTQDSSPSTHQPYTWRLDAFRYAPAENNDKLLMIVPGAHHDFGGISSVRYPGAGPAVTDQLALMKATTLAFWDMHLKQTLAARDFLTPTHLHQLAGNDLHFESK